MFSRLSMVIGLLVGAFMALLMVMMASYIFCSWCPAYMGKENSKPRSECSKNHYSVKYNLCSGSWNRLPHANSTQSEVNNIYSQGFNASTSISPADTSSSFQTQLATQEMASLPNTLPRSLSLHNSKFQTYHQLF